MHVGQLRSSVLLSILFLSLLQPSRASADRLCDSSFENCRTPLLELIRNETVAIDVAFWFMEDTRYATALIDRWRAGVPVRVLMDARAVTQYGYTVAARPLQMLSDAGIPMRTKTSGGILHFKTMIFAGQQTVEFSAANYSSEAFVPIQPYVNYVDEIILFSDRAPVVNSFMTRFDDVWTDTASFSAYANQIGSPVRQYPTYPQAAELNFVPWENFRTRSLRLYTQETQRIDAIMYRITDRAQSDAMIAAVQRGVTVRLLSEPREYRNPNRLWHSWNVDRMYAAGIQVRHRSHAGLVHEKLTILNGLGHVIVGSSNWTSASATSQHEHNLFTSDPGVLAWVRDHFDRKWNNRAGYVETEPFVPLPPDIPTLIAPADGATDQPGTVTLQWYAGPWAHKYDVYVGTSPSSLSKILADRELGPSEHTTDYVTWTVSGLTRGTTYYWRIVSRTMANIERPSRTRSFTVGAGAPAAGSVSSVSAVRLTDGSMSFTANTQGGTALDYKWWLFDGAVWRVLRNWSASPTITWKATVPGTYRVGVWVRSAGAPFDAAQSHAGVDVTVGGTVQAAPRMNRVSPTTTVGAAGAPIAFTANATGGVAPLQFKWWLFDGKAWSVLREWSPDATILWTPSRAGTYRVGAWVRSAGRSSDTPQSNAGVDITAVWPFRTVQVARTGTTPHPAGVALTVAATPNGGSAPPEFKWWLFDGTAWVVLRNWSPSSTVSWTPPHAGTYRVGVWVRSAGIMRDAPETNAGIDIVVKNP